MTPSERELREAVARGWCSPENAHKQMDPVLAEAIVREVALLNRAPTPEEAMEAAAEK